MKKVFIPHVVKKRDPQTGEQKPIFDFTAAKAFGEIVELSDAKTLHGESMLTSGALWGDLLDFQKGDYLLCVGDPAMIALCAGILLRRFDVLRVLRWDRITKTYQEVELFV